MTHTRLLNAMAEDVAVWCDHSVGLLDQLSDRLLDLDTAVRDPSSPSAHDRAFRVEDYLLSVQQALAAKPPIEGDSPQRAHWAAEFRPLLAEIPARLEDARLGHANPQTPEPCRRLTDLAIHREPVAEPVRDDEMRRKRLANFRARARATVTGYVAAYPR